MMAPKQWDDEEPTAGALAAIEAEWPLIEAELAALDAEIRALLVAGGPGALDWRRLRRAEHLVLAAGVRLLASRRDDAIRAWVMAGRDTEREAWEALYTTLYPPPDRDDEMGLAS